MQNNLHPLFAGIINDITRMNGILNEAEPVHYIFTESELDELAAMINADLYGSDEPLNEQRYLLSSGIEVFVSCGASFNSRTPNYIDGYIESYDGGEMLYVDISELYIMNPKSDLEFKPVYDKTQLEKKIIF